MRRGSLFWGVVLVIFGFILLADNLGLFGDINLWAFIWPLIGPLFLILLGAWILFGHFSRKALEIKTGNIPLGDAQNAHVRLQHGAGRLFVSAGSLPGDLLNGEFSGGVEMDVQRSSGRLTARLHSPASSFPFNWVPGDSLDWTVRLGEDIPLELVIETGASDSELDLSHLQVQDFHLKSGASSVEIHLPGNTRLTRVNIEAGAAAVNLHIPPGVAASIQSSSALASLDIDQERFPSYGQGYRSPDYDTADNRVDIKIQMGVGSVSVRS